MKKHKKIIVILAVVVFVGILVGAGWFFIQNSNPDKKNAQQQARLFKKIQPETNNKNNRDYLEKAKKTNSQVIAWIKIPGTKINFPIVQNEDNSYYLNHDFEKAENYMGTPFLDYRNKSDFSDFNNIVYSHNISGQYMFAPLLEFKNKDYFDSHKTGKLITSKKIYTIHFIACDVIESDGFTYETVFLSQKDKEFFLKSLTKKAVCQSEFDSKKILKKQLVTFSTCSYEYENARTVLVGFIE